MVAKTDLLQRRLEKQANAYSNDSQRIITLAERLRSASSDFHDKVAIYQKQWMELLDLKTEQATIIWCRSCRKIKPSDTAVYINTTGKDDEGGSNFGYICECEQCAKGTFADSPWYGKADSRGKQAYFIAYRMEKREGIWYVMNSHEGEKQRPQDTSWIESCFKGYYTGRAGYNEDAIKDMAEYLSMPTRLEMQGHFSSENNVGFTTLRLPKSQTASAAA